MLALDLSSQSKREINRDIETLRGALETADITEVKDLQGQIKGLKKAMDIIVQVMRRNEIDDDD